MNRRTLLLTIAGLWCVLAQAQGNPPGRDVDSLLRIARENNPDYVGLRYEAEAAGERVGSAGALPDPRLRTELMDITKAGKQSPSLAPNRVGSTRYTLMQEIPWYGKRDLKREIAELEAESAKGRASGGWSEIAARIKTSYAQLYYVHQNEVLTREIIDLLGRLEKIAQVRYAGGLAAQQDVIRAQVEQSGMRGELIDLEMDEHHLHSRLNALLGRPSMAPMADPESLRPLPSPLQLDYPVLIERVKTGNPVLFAEEARLKSAEKSRELTYKNRYPDVTLGLVPNQFENAVKQWDLMLELNIPLQQSSRRAQEREAEALLAAARARRDGTANQVLSDLAENLAGLNAAQRSAQLISSSQLPQAELTFQSALAGYENGKLDFATLLDAQRQIRQAKQNRIKAMAEGQARLAEIERLIGGDL